MCPRWCKCALMWHRSSNFEKGSYGRQKFDSCIDLILFVYVCGIAKLTPFQSHCLSTLHRGWKEIFAQGFERNPEMIDCNRPEVTIGAPPKGHWHWISFRYPFTLLLLLYLREDSSIGYPPFLFLWHCCFLPLSGNLHILSPLRSFSWRTEGSLWSGLGISPST